jgi:hypothetical protein
MRLVLILVWLVAACGGGKAPAAPENRRQETGDGQQATGNREDAGAAVAVAWPDAGEPADPVPDAGLMELGAAQCEMVFARVLACPQIGAGLKDELRKKQIEIRQMAVDPKNREEVASACRQLTEMIEETLRRISC